MQIRGQIEVLEEECDNENIVEVPEYSRVGTNEGLESVEKLMHWVESQNILDKSTRLSEIYNLRALI